MKTTRNTNNLEIVVTTNLNKNIKNKTHKIVLTDEEVKEAENFLVYEILHCGVDGVKFGGYYRFLLLAEIVFSDRVINSVIEKDLGKDYDLEHVDKFNEELNDWETIHILTNKNKTKQVRVEIEIEEKTKNKVEVKMYADELALEKFFEGENY